MTAFNTIDDIIDDILFKVERDEIDTVLGLKPAPADEPAWAMAWAESSFGRWIRNTYGLWHTHPLTARWREQGPNDLRDGVDYSDDHPDNLSAKIIDRMRERLA